LERKGVFSIPLNRGFADVRIYPYITKENPLIKEQAGNHETKGSLEDNRRILGKSNVFNSRRRLTQGTLEFGSPIVPLRITRVPLEKKYLPFPCSS
jgi:hypothetical protein